VIKLRLNEEEKEDDIDAALSFSICDSQIHKTEE